LFSLSAIAPIVKKLDGGAVRLASAAAHRSLRLHSGTLEFFILVRLQNAYSSDTAD
jgi:hypothetical protein